MGKRESDGMGFVSKLPWWSAFPLSGGFGLVSMFAPDAFPEWARVALFWMGVILLAIGILAAGWHYRPRNWLSRNVWWRLRLHPPDTGVTTQSGMGEDANSKMTFDQAFHENATDRVPFIRIRDIAPQYGIDFGQTNPIGGSNEAYHIEGVLRQAVVDGNLKVWGRQYRGDVKDNDPLVSIPPEHFKDYGFVHGLLHYQTPNIHTATGTIQMKTWGQKGIKNVTFYDLHLSYRDLQHVLKRYSNVRENAWKDIGNANI